MPYKQYYSTERRGIIPFCRAAQVAEDRVLAACSDFHELHAYRDHALGLTGRLSALSLADPFDRLMADIFRGDPAVADKIFIIASDTTRGTYGWNRAGDTGQVRKRLYMKSDEID